MALSRFFLSHAGSLNRSAFDQIMPLLKKKDFSAIARVAADSRAPIARMIGAGIWPCLPT
jgi:biopolymer transport protein ExbB